MGAAGTLAKDASSKLGILAQVLGDGMGTGVGMGDATVGCGVLWSNDAGGARKGREKHRHELQRGAERLSPSTCTWVALQGLLLLLLLLIG